MLRRFLLLALAIVLVPIAWLAGMALGLYGSQQEPGEVTPVPIPASVVGERTGVEGEAARGIGADSAKQILFGDLHVHTTYSVDAFQTSLPLLQGDGAHPPADACDFARYCSALDFWSINDHAEALSPALWAETKESIRQCNAVAGDPGNPDVVAFLGWEWSQIGQTRETHYGHKNVIFRDTEEDRVPRRPIAARGGRNLFDNRTALTRVIPPLFDLANRQLYYDFEYYAQEFTAVPPCPDGVASPDLPIDCAESTSTPRELFAKLDEWKFETLVIPHGTTWGFYTPVGSSWDKQLANGQHDPETQKLIEVYSGHGNSEEFRPVQDVVVGSDGSSTCPEPEDGFVPSCWRAGEIIAARCEAERLDAAECERRSAEARQNYLDAGVSGWRTVPGAQVTDWLDAGQCKDCFLPTFNSRPRSSVQYIEALTNFDDPGKPRRFRFGFMASSDVHSARPGTGFKEFGRHQNADARGPATPAFGRIANPGTGEPVARSIAFDSSAAAHAGLFVLEFERQASFFMTGGLTAVHSAGRARDAIWSALESREVYGTSGDRILLWFDLLNGPGGSRVPMGGEVAMNEAPSFEVRAVGARVQTPGCPEYSEQALTPERLERLCRGECYNPGDERKLVTRIEVVRIRPQATPGEDVAELIEDPWRVIDCPGDPNGCTARFDDPEYASSGRDALYYVRAIEAPSDAVNAAALRCSYDIDGNCVEVKPCYGDFRTPFEDDCLAPVEERAWSSPIYVDRAK